MWRVKISRWANAYMFGGDPRIMISTRVYLEHRVFLTKVIDKIFFIVRGEIDHCRNSFYYDMGELKSEN